MISFVSSIVIQIGFVIVGHGFGSEIDFLIFDRHCHFVFDHSQICQIFVIRTGFVYPVSHFAIFGVSHCVNGFVICVHAIGYDYGSVIDCALARLDHR